MKAPLGSVVQERQKRTTAIQGWITGMPVIEAAFFLRATRIIFVLRGFNADGQKNFQRNIRFGLHECRKGAGVQTRILKTVLYAITRTIGPWLA